MLDNNIVAVITNILALVIMLAFAAKALLIFSQVFVAIGRMILGFLHAVKRWRTECRKKEFLNTCQMMANMIETLSPAICEMAKNGVSINLDVAALFRSATESQSNQREELSHSIKKMLLALLKMALAALLRALLNIASKALLEKLF